MNVLKSYLKNYEPNEVVIDFEDAFRRSFGALFPNTRIKGCHFHLCQCIMRHIQSCGLQKLYSEDRMFSASMKMLTALAFVPVVDVIHVYEALIDSPYFVNNSELLDVILSYFERTWVGVKNRYNVRGEPLFPLDMWNSYADTVHDLPRTNNAVEGWNNGFSSRVGQAHAQMGKFLNKLKTEQNLTDILIEQADTGLEISEPKKKKYKDYDQRLKNIAFTYKKDDVLDYLNNIAKLIVL